MYTAVKLKKLLPLLIAFTGLLLLMLFPSVSAQAISKGLTYSFEILIPSLFPFMVIASFIMRTNGAALIGKIFAPVCKAVFGLPSCCAGGILLSMMGGFPVGAKCVQILYNQQKITAQQAEQMMCFFVCAGPAFLITAVGTIMLNNPMTGWILYLSQILSALILGWLVRRSPKTDAVQQAVQPIQSENEPISRAFISAVTDAASSVLSITALVMIFSLIMSLMNALVDLTGITVLLTAVGLPQRVIPVIIPVVLEVTAGCKSLCDFAMPLWSFSLALGFGGMCIHFQIFDILKDVPFRKKKYLTFRVINSLLSGVITYLICLVYRPSAAVFALSGGGQAEFSAAGIAGSIAIVVLSVIFVLKKKKKNYSGHQSFFPDI